MGIGSASVLWRAKQLFNRIFVYPLPLLLPVTHCRIPPFGNEIRANHTSPLSFRSLRTLSSPLFSLSSVHFLTTWFSAHTVNLGPLASSRTFNVPSPPAISARVFCLRSLDAPDH